jgi:tRNA threonylcarbamoyladenosine biosynthesis protein TsaE
MGEPVTISTSGPAETLALGRRLAALLAPGDIVLLAGRLGCGKTLFVAGVAEGLGVTEPVTSPSFVLVRSYHGFVPVIHADVYRLGSSGEFEDLELPDWSRDGVLLVEWGHAIEQGVPGDHLLVEIDITGDTERTFRFVPKGDWPASRLVELNP